MAKLENISIDARTFPQFCASLTKSQWVELQGELSAKLVKSAQAIYMWKRTGRMPESKTERVKISDHINKKFGILTKHWTLFPETQS